MATYKENREKIKKRLYELNTTLDREQAYNATVDYIIRVATDAWTKAAQQYGWEMDDVDAHIKSDLHGLGLIPPKKK